MATQESTQSSQESRIPPPEVSEPATPVPSHATLPGAFASPSAASFLNEVQAGRVKQANTTFFSSMSSPPSSQVPAHMRPKTRTPTPTMSHLSSPPPTIQPQQLQVRHGSTRIEASITDADIHNASSEELRAMVRDLIPSLQEARTSAAHHKLQYQMLSMQSAEAAERMAVEMEMAQREVEMQAEQHRLLLERQAVQSRFEEDRTYRKVHVDEYDAMLLRIQDLRSQNIELARSTAHQKRIIEQQAQEMASLDDRVLLLKERIKENRDHLNRYRRGTSVMETPRTDRGTPFRTPGRNSVSGAHAQDQPFAALLQASDMMAQEGAKRKRGHQRNTHSLSALPETPRRTQVRAQQGAYYTPDQTRYGHVKAPHTAPVFRPEAGYAVNPIPAPRLLQDLTRGHESDGTVSASEDSEAETDVPDHESNLGESQASRMASQMLLNTPTKSTGKGRGPAQGKLYGQVRKQGIQRDGMEPAAKRARVADPVGLGIGDIRS